jgi:hypothetical protein
MVHSGRRPVASLIGDNFERLNRVANSSNRYYWKCNSLAAKQMAFHDERTFQSVPEAHPLKVFAVTILSTVGHAGKVERTFSDLGTTQSARRCTVKTLGKIRANLHHHSAMKAAGAGKYTRHLHAHMHTREEVVIDIEVAGDLEASFAWAPPLSKEPRDEVDLLASPESISPDDIATEFVALEEDRS